MPLPTDTFCRRLARASACAVLLLGVLAARLAVAESASLPEPSSRLSGSSRTRFT